MARKKTNQQKRKAQDDEDEVSSPTRATRVPHVEQESTSSTPISQSPPPPVQETEKVEEVVDTTAQAEAKKEEGNAAFKAGKYDTAISLYSRAIALNPNEISYLTNRAASYVMLKRFRPALADCQLAISLQPTSSPPPIKTLVRLARCHLALGATPHAQAALRTILEREPDNSAAIQLRSKIQVLEGHLKNFEKARANGDWGMARLALDRCFASIEAEGSETPMEWKVWKIEGEIAKGNWEVAATGANDALYANPTSPEVLALRSLVLFLTGKIPQALQNITSALRLDSGHEPAQKLRKRIKDVERLKEEGNVAFKAGKLEEAIEKYTETLERIGQNEDEGKGGLIRATLLSNRATTYLKLNKHDLALADTTASLALHPTSFKALRTRARIHLHMESFDAAVADYKSALEAAGASSSPHHHSHHHHQSPFGFPPSSHGASSSSGSGAGGAAGGEATEADIRALRADLKKAEAALKRSKTKDYYKILGVARDCGDAEIKKAYRRESLIHHPDKGGDEEKFKLVVEAHAVLSDPARRQRYDLGEDEDGGMSGAGGSPFGGMDLSELFAQFNGGGAGGFGGGPGMGGGGFGGGGPFGGAGFSAGGSGGRSRARGQPSYGF